MSVALLRRAAVTLVLVALAPRSGSAAPAPAAHRPVHRMAAAAPKAKAKAAPGEKPIASVASEARVDEELGAYALALKQLQLLRSRAAPDADLELAIALDEARVGLADSAWARLYGPLLSAALADSAGLGRRREYPFQREPLWLDGKFDGWYWYIARARAELALALRRWPEAVAAARIAAAARPFAGKEHLLLAIAAGRAGDDALARAEAARAAALDPVLPEAQWLNGLWRWREGNRAGAADAFRAAIAADAGFRPAAVSLARLALPGAAPDSLPVRFLIGIRQVAMLTSAMGPKPEEYIQNDQLATLYGEPSLPVPDSLKARIDAHKPMHLFVTVLVDETGHAVVDDLPWFTDAQLPEPLVPQLLRLVLRWHFQPAVRLSQARRAWATVEVPLKL